MEDALAFGGACISLLNHADRVKAACLAQLVNVIAPIMTETGGPAWRQTIFYPFAHMSNLGRGRVLRARSMRRPTRPATTIRAAPRSGGLLCPQCAYLKFVAVQDERADSLFLFNLNRDGERDLPGRGRGGGPEGGGGGRAHSLTGGSTPPQTQTTPRPDQPGTSRKTWWRGGPGAPRCRPPPGR